MDCTAVHICIYGKHRSKKKHQAHRVRSGRHHAARLRGTFRAQPPRHGKGERRRHSGRPGHQDACAILFRRASPSCRLFATPSPQTAAPCGIFWKTKCSAPISFQPRPRSKCRKFLTITSFMWNTTCTGAALQSAATRIKPAPFSAFLKKNITSSQKIIRSRTTSPRI